MGKDRLLRSNTSKLNIFSNWTDYGLSGHMVFDQSQFRPAGKMYLKTQNWRNDYVMIFLLHKDYVIGEY